MTEIKNIRVTFNWALDFRKSWEEYAYIVAINTLGNFYQLQCLFQEREEVFGKMAVKFRTMPARKALALVLAFQGWNVALGSQQYTKAIALFEEALSLSAQNEDSNFVSLANAYCNLRLSDVMVQLGNYVQAKDLGLKSLKSQERSSVPELLTFELAHVGYVMFLMENFEEAKRLLQESVAIAQKYDMPIGIADAQNYLGEVYLAMHAFPEARQLFVENVAFSKQFAYPKGTVLALIGAGEVACHLHDYSGARQVFAEALTMAIASHQIPYVLRALTEIAAFLAQTGDSAGAQRLLIFVLDHRATSHETNHRAQQILEQQRRHAVSVQPRTSDSLDVIVQHLLENQLAESPLPDLPATNSVSTNVLSDREMEMLRLIADGLSNKEIADKLFLAVSTVKWYLSEIYSKIHVTSRTQAVVRGKELHLIT